MSFVFRDLVSEVSRGEAMPRALIEAWRDEPFDPMRIERAYLRFRRRSSTASRRHPAVFGRWLALGIAIGMGSVYAASAASNALSGTKAAPVVAPSASPVVPLAANRASRPRRAIEPSEPSTPKPTAIASGTSPLPPPPVLGNVPAVASAEQWRRAARGMRQGDLEGASAALSELSRHGSAADRESALLVQAQLLLSQGKTEQAKGMLQTLADSASAPSVRRKSTELLSRKKELPSQRSFDPAAGTNVP